MAKIRSVPELYACALAIEREAAARYAELAERMADLGNEALADLFAALARFEAAHVAELERRSSGIALPPAPEGHSWIEQGAPATEARELVYRLMTPRQALGIALGAERRAQAFFEGALMGAADPAFEALAREMAAEEQEHAALVERMLERTPEPLADWSALFEEAATKAGSPPRRPAPRAS